MLIAKALADMCAQHINMSNEIIISIRSALADMCTQYVDCNFLTNLLMHIQSY